jgi:hypothetical protein
MGGILGNAAGSSRRPTMDIACSSGRFRVECAAMLETDHLRVGRNNRCRVHHLFQYCARAAIGHDGLQRQGVVGIRMLLLVVLDNIGRNLHFRSWSG